MMESAVPVLPVRDLLAALDHYRRLGFEVLPAPDAGYGYATRGGVTLHLRHVPDLDPAANTTVVYLTVDDADRLHVEWRWASVPVRLQEPRNTENGVREGAHIDPDGNVLRFGSPIRRP